MKTSKLRFCLGLLARLCLPALPLVVAAPSLAAVIYSHASDDGDFELRCETVPFSASTPTASPEFGPPHDLGFELNRMTRLVVSLSGSPGPYGRIPLVEASLAFDARMADYDLGMVVRPKVTQLTAGRFLVEGVKLHAAGTWKLEFTVTRHGKDQKMVAEVRV